MLDEYPPWYLKWLLLVLLCQLSHAGRYVSLNTTSDHAHYFLNDLGIDVKSGLLVFSVTSQQNAIIQLSEKQTRSGNTCDVIFGSSSNTAIVVRESCSGCGSPIMKSGTFLDTVTPAYFWVDFSDSTNLKVGQGTMPGLAELFSYKWTTQFEINYATATSYYNYEGQWHFLIDTAPSFVHPAPGGSTIVTVAEDVQIGSSVITLSADDAEADVLTFYVTGQHSATFAINGSDVVLSESLDYEMVGWFLVTVICSDGRHNVTAAFTLNVSDVIDETPDLTLGTVTSVQEELAVGSTIVGLFIVDDRDQGDTLRFSLEGLHSSYFTINETTGKITVAQRLDREAGISRLDDIRVKVTDFAGHISLLSLDLVVDDINDNRPQFGSSLYMVNVTSSTPSNTPLLAFTVSDSDVGNNGDLSMTLLTPETGFWVSGLNLYVNTSLLDFIAQSLFTLTVEASDSATESANLTAVAVVYVQVELSNDYDPVWKQPVPDTAGWFPELSISENLTIGSIVLCLSASDEDLGQFNEVTYLMTSVVAEDGQNSSDKFSLDPTSGCLMTRSGLDRDVTAGGTAFYLFTFEAHDTGSRLTEASLKVGLTEVNDNAPIFSQTVYIVQLSCNTRVGDNVIQISASDADLVSMLRFAFTTGSSNYFSLDNVTGEITLMKHLTTASGGSMSHVLCVTVSDRGVPELTSTATVIVQIYDCSETTSSDAGDAKLKLTNQLLMAACGLLGAGLLLSTILFCAAKSSQTTLVNPVTRPSNVTKFNTDRWSTRRSLNSVPSGTSSSSGDGSVVTDLTDSTSCLSLQLV